MDRSWRIRLINIYRIRIKYLLIDRIKDLRVHSEMYPTDGTNIYKACLAGTRR